VFLNYALREPPTAATSTRAPATPTGTASIQSLTSKHSAVTYDYKITGVNNWGESGALTLAANTVTGATQGVRFTLADGGGANAATGFRVYRKLSTETAYKYLWTYPIASVADDVNQYRHGCTHGLLLDFDPDQVIRVRQLMNFFALPLARLDMSDRKLFVLALCLVAYNPKKIIWLKNLGSSAWT
jgi:hypothetical protein